MYSPASAHLDPHAVLPVPTGSTASMHVVERADGRLRAKPYGALRRIKCEYRDGVLTLRGIVSTYYLKQLAQEAVATLDGIEKVDNRIDVYEGANTAEGQDFQQGG